jgi:microcompartment protein CcmL/EutN
LAIACNEALKAANVKLIDIQPTGATGRLIISGTEAEVDSSAEAAIKILHKLNEMKKSGIEQQLN